jgi:predicted RNase H-like HicB family nuclease
MKDKYTFPALFCCKEKGKDVGIVFPDLPGCASHGDSESDAWRCAKEVLSLHLWGMEEDGDDIPEPTPIQDITYSEYEEAGWRIVIVLIEVWMPAFREKMAAKATTRAVTLPRWLDKMGKKANINYSQVLQDGIMERLGVSRATVNAKKAKIPA